LAGGLGNQLFQYAAALTISRRVDRRISVHLGGLNRYQSSRDPLALKVVKLHADTHVWSGDEFSITSFAIVNLRLGRYMPVSAINDKNFGSVIRKTELPARVFFLDGYFQRGWTSEEFRAAIANLKLTPEILSPPNSSIKNSTVVIHFRGTDFLFYPSLQLAGKKFYSNAIARATTEGFRDFFIVTDDTNLAKSFFTSIGRSFPFADFRFSESPLDSLADFHTLLAAPARIVGNSTFSWWAAVLDPRRGRTWSPGRFSRDFDRDFLLDHEIVVPID